MKIRLTLWMCIIVTSPLFAQLRYPSIKIQEITITDSILIHQIEKLIQDEVNNEEDKHQFFKRGLGYVNLSYSNFTDRDVLRKYYISPRMIGFRKNDPDSRYPLFYSFVAKRMVLIDIHALENSTSFKITKKSKRQFRKKLEPYLEKTQNITVYDSLGNVVIRDRYFRVDWFRLHSGRYIYIYNNRPPLVLNEREEEIKQLKSNK